MDQQNRLAIADLLAVDRDPVELVPRIEPGEIGHVIQMLFNLRMFLDDGVIGFLDKGRGPHRIDVHLDHPLGVARDLCRIQGLPSGGARQG